MRAWYTSTVADDASPPTRLATWARNEVAVRALASVAERFRGAGVPLLPVKGIVLSRWLYADVAERSFMDIDLLVPRRSFADACRALEHWGPHVYRSLELGEDQVTVEGMSVELHAEVGRMELTDLTVDDVLARATHDTRTFEFPILRLDDVDHLILVAVNAVKDGFVLAPRHIPSDLERLLARVEPPRLVERARDNGFATGLACTAEWMARAHGSQAWAEVLQALGAPRPLFRGAFRAFQLLPQPPDLLAYAFATWTHDRLGTRSRAFGRICRRYLTKAIGRTPP
jgi:hypothetical protein